MSEAASVPFSETKAAAAIPGSATASVRSSLMSNTGE
jgi:hypothetical protein